LTKLKIKLPDFPTAKPIFIVQKEKRLNERRITLQSYLQELLNSVSLIEKNIDLRKFLELH